MKHPIFFLMNYMYLSGFNHFLDIHIILMIQFDSHICSGWVETTNQFSYAFICFLQGPDFCLTHRSMVSTGAEVCDLLERAAFLPSQCLPGR